MTPDEIYYKFKEWNPEIAKQVKHYIKWGSHSILLFLLNGMNYKVKICEGGRFIMQVVSIEDIKKKFMGGEGNESN